LDQCRGLQQLLRLSQGRGQAGEVTSAARSTAASTRPRARANPDRRDPDRRESHRWPGSLDLSERSTRVPDRPAITGSSRSDVLRRPAGLNLGPSTKASNPRPTRRTGLRVDWSTEVGSRCFPVTLQPSGGNPE
jgi:hypothetical protein